MFAVIKAGGKQHRVAANDTITVNRLTGEPGDVIAFEDVVLFGNEGKTEFGHAAYRRRDRGRRDSGTIARPEDHRLQEAPPAELHAQAWSPAALHRGAHHRDPDRREEADLKAKPKATPRPHPQGGGGQGRCCAAEHPGRRIDQISGLGATIKKKLNAAGIVTVQQIADWTDADVAKYDAELNLHGRNHSRSG